MMGEFADQMWGLLWVLLKGVAGLLAVVGGVMLTIGIIWTVRFIRTAR